AAFDRRDVSAGVRPIRGAHRAAFRTRALAGVLDARRKHRGCGLARMRGDRIMEKIGNERATNHRSVHGPGYSGGEALTATYDLPDGANLSDEFHVFAAEWEPGVIRFYVDDHLYEARTPSDLGDGRHWVYDHPFFVILNVAVGGNFPG